MTNGEAIFQLKQCDIEYVFTREQKEAYKMAMQSLEKQIPKKMIVKPHIYLDLDLMYVCPNCETEYNRFYEGKPHCMFCGQKLLWEEE